MGRSLKPIIPVFAALLFALVALTHCDNDETDRAAPPAAGTVVITPGDGDLKDGCLAGKSPYPNGKTALGVLDAGWEAGGTRRFRIHVPESYAPGEPTPLVLLLHGAVSDPYRIETRQSMMNDLAESDGFIVVYPEGTGGIRTWNAETCCGFAQRNDVDDVGFIRTLLDRLDEQLCVDPDRVYAAGMSNGGMMSFRLACEMPDRFAAVGAVAATDGTTDCVLSSPVSVLKIHGTQDRRVPWEGGPGDPGCGTTTDDFRSALETEALWAERNRCVSDREDAYEILTGTVPEVTCRRRLGCEADLDVIGCDIKGGGHQWPGDGEPVINPQCANDGILFRDYNASRELWSFFLSHPKRRSF